MHLPLFVRVLHLMKAPGENGNTEEARDEAESVRDTQ